MKTKIILRTLLMLTLFAQPLFAAQMSQEEAKKLAAQQQTQGIYNYLQTSARNATQRIRNLFNYGQLPWLISAGLITNLLRALIRTQPPPSNFEIKSALSGLYLPFLAELIAFDILEKAIEGNNLEKIKSILATGFINIQRSAHTILPFPVDQNLYPLPLTLGIHSSNPAIVKLLLQNGALVKKSDIDSVYIFPTDTTDIQNAKQTIKRMLEARVKHQPIERLYPQEIHKTRQKEQKKLRAQYLPTESIATEALEELHKSMYGEAELEVTRDIMDIVNEYLTPTYVNRPFLPIAQPVEALEKKEQEEKQN